MGSLAIWTFIFLFYQTVIVLTVGTLTHRCQLAPGADDGLELTLMKLLYLHDPAACARTVHYTYSRGLTGREDEGILVWFRSNAIAERFRHNIRITLYIQVAWFLLGCGYTVYNRRPWAFYALLLPFTAAGVAALVLDVVVAAHFVVDSLYAQTDLDILHYINATSSSVQSLRPLSYPSRLGAAGPPAARPAARTAWLPLMMAYLSVRGVAQWFANLWLVEDNYLEGLANYRRLRTARAPTNIKKRRNTRPAASVV